MLLPNHPFFDSALNIIENRKAFDELRIQCSRCKAKPALDGSWRWNGEIWEHKCADSHPQAGHYPSEFAT